MSRLDGRQDAPALMLSNSLGTDLHMWDGQVGPFTRHFRLVRYDRRGHGKSGVAKAPYSMTRLGRDVVAVLDGLGIETINWCGLSMGGMVGQWLGAHAATRIEKLVLTNTACYYPDKTAWADRMNAARTNGMAAMAGPMMERWFTKDFRERSPEAVARIKDMFAKTELEGFLGCCAAVRDMDHRPLLPNIKAPTLVMAGRFDVATTAPMNEFVKNEIPGAQYELIDAPHMANVENPRDYTEAVLRFLLN